MKNHHSGQKDHSTLTAKLTMDTHIQRHRENNKAVAILSTDLSAGFDTVDTRILMNKLEHLGIHDKEHNIIYTYLTDRMAYTEIQGFHSTIKKQPNCSVIQGGKLSSTLYTTYTLDVTELSQIMNDPEKCSKIVNKSKFLG